MRLVLSYGRDSFSGRAACWYRCISDASSERCKDLAPFSYSRRVPSRGFYSLCIRPDPPRMREDSSGSSTHFRRIASKKRSDFARSLAVHWLGANVHKCCGGAFEAATFASAQCAITHRACSLYLESVGDVMVLLHSSRVIAIRRPHRVGKAKQGGVEGDADGELAEAVGSCRTDARQGERESLPRTDAITTPTCAQRTTACRIFASPLRPLSTSPVDYHKSRDIPVRLSRLQ